MTHPTDRDEDYQRRTDAIKVVLLRNWPTMCDDGYDLGAVAHDLLLAATPLPAAPAHDAVGQAKDALRDAREFIMVASRDGDRRLRVLDKVEKALDAILAAERAQRDAGAEGDQRSQDAAKGGE